MVKAPRDVDWWLAVVAWSGVVVAIAGAIVLHVVHHDAVIALLLLYCAGVTIAGGLGFGLVRLARRTRTLRRPVHWGVLLAGAGAVALSVAPVLLLYGPTEVTGVLVLAVAPSVVMGGWMAAGTARVKVRDFMSGAPAVRRDRLVAVMLLAVALLGVAGFCVRMRPDYVGRYGTPMKVGPGRCTTTYQVWGGDVADTGVTECETFYENEDHSFTDATLHVATDERVDVHSIEAYAMGDRLESRRRVGRIHPVTVLGRYLSAWLLIGTAAEALLVTWIVVRWWRSDESGQ